MNSAGFLGLERIDEGKFALDVAARVATGGGFLFGGAGLGAGIAALEAVSQRRVVSCDFWTEVGAGSRRSDDAHGARRNRL